MATIDATILIPPNPDPNLWLTFISAAFSIKKQFSNDSFLDGEGRVSYHWGSPKFLPKLLICQNKL